MPEPSELIGPFPDGVDHETYDKLRRRVLWSLPTGLYALGARAGDHRNLMTLSLATQVSMEPKQVGVSVLKDAVTHELISDGKVFSLCLIDRNDRELGRKFSKPGIVDEAAKTINGFDYFDGITGVPILTKSASWLEFELRQSIDVGDHSFFIGEVVNVGARDEDAEILRMEDTRMNYGG